MLFETKRTLERHRQVRIICPQHWVCLEQCVDGGRIGQRAVWAESKTFPEGFLCSTVPVPSPRCKALQPPPARPLPSPRDQGKDQQPWGHWEVGSTTPRQQSKSPLPEQHMGKSFPKATQALVLLRLLGWQKELWREAAHLACEDLFLSSRWNQRQCWSVVTSSLILQHPHNPSLSPTSPQSRNLPRFAV